LLRQRQNAIFQNKEKKKRRVGEKKKKKKKSMTRKKKKKKKNIVIPNIGVGERIGGEDLLEQKLVFRGCTLTWTHASRIAPTLCGRVLVQRTSKRRSLRSSGSGERGGLARAFGATWLSIRVGLTGKFGIGGGGDELLVVVVVRAVLVVVVVARRVAAVVALGATHLGGLLLVAAASLRRLEALRHVRLAFLRHLRRLSLRLPVLLRVRRSCDIIQYACQKVRRVVVQCHSLTIRSFSRVGTKKRKSVFFSFASRSRHSLSTRNTTISFIETHSTNSPSYSFAHLPRHRRRAAAQRVRSRHLDNRFRRRARFCDRSPLPTAFPSYQLFNYIDSHINRRIRRHRDRTRASRSRTSGRDRASTTHAVMRASLSNTLKRIFSRNFS
jgi:hypothetical protein